MRCAALVALSGCATIFAGGPDAVPVSTNPPGAYVYVNGMFAGQSPTQVSLDRAKPAQIQVYLPGHDPVVMVRHKGYNGWFFANIVWMATIAPIIIDIVTENWQRYANDPIALALVPTPVRGAAPPVWYQQQPTTPPYLPPTAPTETPPPWHQPPAQPWVPPSSSPPAPPPR